VGVVPPYNEQGLASNQEGSGLLLYPMQIGEVSKIVLEVFAVVYDITLTIRK